MSDVWSFGIVLHELFKYGEDPYNQMTIEEVIEKVRDKGYRMPKPNNCPNEVYAVMQDCWSSSQDRPTFEKVLADLLAYKYTLPASIVSDPNNNNIHQAIDRGYRMPLATGFNDNSKYEMSLVK